MLCYYLFKLKTNGPGKKKFGAGKSLIFMSSFLYEPCEHIEKEIMRHVVILLEYGGFEGKLYIILLHLLWTHQHFTDILFLYSSVDLDSLRQNILETAAFSWIMQIALEIAFFWGKFWFMKLTINVLHKNVNKKRWCVLCLKKHVQFWYFWYENRLKNRYASCVISLVIPVLKRGLSVYIHSRNHVFLF